MYSLWLQVEARSLNQGVRPVLPLPPEAQGRIRSLALPASGGCWHSLAGGPISPVSASVFTWISYACVKSPSVSPVRAFVMASRAHPIIKAI